AVAVEFVHNFSLLHDDVMDRDERRRHRPAAWTLFGVGRAIIAGDSLLTMAVESLLGVSGDAGPTGSWSAANRAASVLAGATARSPARRWRATSGSGRSPGRSWRRWPPGPPPAGSCRTSSPPRPGSPTVTIGSTRPQRSSTRRAAARGRSERPIAVCRWPWR